MLFPCRCRLGLDGVAVPTLLLDLVLILFSGSDLVFSEVLVPSVLVLSLVLDLTLVVGLILAPVLILGLVLVLLVFGLCLALVLLALIGWFRPFGSGFLVLASLVPVLWSWLSLHWCSHPLALWFWPSGLDVLA